ncbi:MAG: DNA/RNA non-specific endonuclease [Treponema sp.]|nr:DNA/RNA non-specific endonuclease [Treponema sp.]
MEEGEVKTLTLTDLELPLCPAVIQGKNCPDHELHEYSGFRLCYRESYELAEWVSYTLTSEELVKESSRTNDFRSDDSITTGSASPADYYKSGYDRGHLAPAADLAWSKASMSESFLMSNMTPQTPSFNRKIWMYLETQVREWAQRYGAVTVVTGPVLDKKASEYPSIGENQVAVPEYFYKVLLVKDGDSYQAIAFLIPNEGWTGTFWDYAVSVDEVEESTSLDFFAALDDRTESAVESSFLPDFWK